MKPSRREFLSVAASVPLALSSLGTFNVQATEAQTRLPLITLFMSGGPSAKETFNPDPPNSPAELRGPLSTIQTRTGNRFSELFPELARRSDQFALIRSIDSGSAEHINAQEHAVLHGNTTVSEQIGERATNGGVPYVVLNPGSDWGGLRQAFRIQHSFAPLYDAETRHFRPPQMSAPTNLTERRRLLEAFDRDIPSPQSQRMQRFRETAFDMIQGGGRFFEALNLPEQDRERYGNSLAGDMTLLAKRFVEQGAGAVTIYHEPENVAWDTHNNMERRMRTLSPGVDRAAATLIDEITEHRLECVFLLMGEMNRTPAMNGLSGRDHWPYGNCAILAGGRIRPGVVHGRTNHQGQIMDGAVQQREGLANTLIMATGGEVDPARPKVREVLRSGS